jgi:integrative and conjugative element protein (TIGR02256 family)
MRELTLSHAIFRRPSGGRFKVDATALAQMLAFRQVSPQQTEAGGMLLGRHICGCDDVVVDEVTIPMPGDRRTRTSFWRAQGGHQQVLDARWSASRGTCAYLGEWHTHPEPTPSPSAVDLRDWRRRLSEDRFDGDFLAFLIVGTHEVRAWEGNRHTLDLTPLESLATGAEL